MHHMSYRRGQRVRNVVASRRGFATESLNEAARAISDTPYEMQSHLKEFRNFILHDYQESERSEWSFVPNFGDDLDPLRASGLARAQTTTT